METKKLFLFAWMAVSPLLLWGEGVSDTTFSVEKEEVIDTVSVPLNDSVSPFVEGGMVEETSTEESSSAFLNNNDSIYKALKSLPIVPLDRINTQDWHQHTATSMFLKSAHAVIFKVDRTEISREDSLWVRDTLLPQLEKLGDKAVIVSRSTASPEGPLSNNHRLSTGRREAVLRVAEYLESLGCKRNNILYDIVDEDYGLLLVMMEESKDRDFERVRDVCYRNENNIRELKKELRQLDSGRLWRRLLSEYFPKLRAVRIMAVDGSKLNTLKNLSRGKDLVVLNDKGTWAKTLAEKDNSVCVSADTFKGCTALHCDDSMYKALKTLPIVPLDRINTQDWHQHTATSMFLKSAHAVIFKVDRTEISREDSLWVRDTLLPQLEKLGDKAVIVSRSTASPEGPLSNNHRLSTGRREAVLRVAKYLESLGYKRNNILYDIVDEDYGLLLVMMEESKDKDFERVRDVCYRNENNIRELKKELHQLDSGRLWRRLLSEYFPKLRAVRIMAVDGSKLNTLKNLSRGKDLVVLNDKGTGAKTLAEKDNSKYVLDDTFKRWTAPSALHRDESMYRTLKSISFVPLEEINTLDWQQHTATSLFLKNARAVIFKVDRTEISHSDSVWVRDTLLPQLERLGDNGVIVSRSTASPEGPLHNNHRLSTGRRMAVLRVAEYLKSLGYKRDNILYDIVDEDYGLLLVMMEEKKDKDLERVREVCFKYENDIRELKKALRRLDKGQLWERLLRDYYPQLRAVRIMAVDVSTIKVPPVVQRLKKNASEFISIKKITIDSPCIRREILSIKTNLPEYGAVVPDYGFCPMPNVALEYYPMRGHFTIGCSLDCPWWIGNTTNHKYFELRNWQLEGRYYFSGNRAQKDKYRIGAMYSKFYLSAYTHLFLYELGFSAKKGYKGEGLGAGLGLGYVLPISHDGHWRLEFGVQFGYFLTRYDPFVYGCPVEGTIDGRYYYKYTGDADRFKKRQYRYSYLGPTRVGIVLTYDLLYRKHPKGVTFRKREKDT